MNRRQFVLGASALLLSSQSARSTGNALDDFPKIDIGIQSYTFRQFNLEQSLQRMQKLGIQHAEFYQKHIPFTSTSAQLEAILKLCREYSITPVSWGVQGFTKNHDKNKALFEFAKSLGLKAMSADPDPDSFDSLDKLCDEYKIAIAIHPHGPAGGMKMHRWFSAEIIMNTVKDHHPLIGSCLDTGHLIRSAQMGHQLNPAEEVRKMGARNFGMHLKDHDNKTKTDVILGKGVLDVAEVFKALKEVNYQGMVALEYEAKPEDPFDDVKGCLDVIRKVKSN